MNKIFSFSNRHLSNNLQNPGAINPTPNTKGGLEQTKGKYRPANWESETLKNQETPQPNFKFRNKENHLDRRQANQKKIENINSNKDSDLYQNVLSFLHKIQNKKTNTIRTQKVDTLQFYSWSEKSYLETFLKCFSYGNNWQQWLGRWYLNFCCAMNFQIKHPIFEEIKPRNKKHQKKIFKAQVKTVIRFSIGMRKVIKKKNSLFHNLVPLLAYFPPLLACYAKHSLNSYARYQYLRSKSS